MKVSLIGLDLIFFWLELNFWPNLRPSLDQLEPNFFSRLDFKVSRLDQKNLSAGIKLLSTGIKFSLAGFNWNFWFQSGSLFSAQRGGRTPAPDGGYLWGGSAPLSFFENFFAFLTSASALSGHQRATMGQLGTQKISPIGLELIFFWLDLNFSWLDLFFPAGFFLA